MKFYTLRNSSDPKIIGVRNGIMQAKIRYDKFSSPTTEKDYLSYFKELRKDAEAFTKKDICFEYIEMLKTAKLTDIISYGVQYLSDNHFIINQKVKDIFDQFTIQEHILFPVKLYSNEDLLKGNYYMFNCKYLPFDIFDFSKTIFFKWHEVYEREYKIFKSLEEFNTNRWLQIEKVYLNEKFNSKLDLFLLPLGGIFVSQKLFNKLFLEKITGINLLPSYDPEVNLAFP